MLMAYVLDRTQHMLMMHISGFLGSRSTLRDHRLGYEWEDAQLESKQEIIQHVLD